MTVHHKNSHRLQFPRCLNSMPENVKTLTKINHNPNYISMYIYEIMMDLLTNKIGERENKQAIQFLKGNKLRIINS